MTNYSLQEVLCEESEVEIKSLSQLVAEETKYDPMTEIRTWLNPVAGTSGTYSYTTTRGEDKDKDDDGGND
jgi:hypothetical protein